MVLIPETMQSVVVRNGSRTPSDLFANWPLVFYQKWMSISPSLANMRHPR